MMPNVNILAIAGLLLWSSGAAAQPAPQEPAPPAPAARLASGTVDIGAGDVSTGSFKAGEYNGLQKKGAFLIGNVDFRGGGAYDSDNAYRWRVRGTDLGLHTRNITAEAGRQGRYRVMFGYDELLRNRSDSYQTPYLGAGTNTLTLPSTWLVPLVPSSTATNNRSTSVSARGLVPAIDGAPYIDTQAGSPTIGGLLTPNAAQMALVNAAVSADLPLFHGVHLSTKRTRYDAAFTANINKAWTLDAAVRTENKDGIRPMGTVSRNTGADISTIIPDLIDTNTSQVTASLIYKRTRGSAQAGYYGSFFNNHVASMNWQNWATTTGTMNQMSSAPDNVFHQINGEGRYSLTRATRVVASGSYARNTQNDPFLVDVFTPVVPVPSLDGLVVSSAFNATLTSRVRKVNLTGAYHFADRDNRTAVHIFQFSDAGETPTASASFPSGPNNPLGAVLAQNANANRPYSYRSNRANVEAAYPVTKDQWVTGGYDFERFSRSCPGSWIDCADAGVTNENRVRAAWRAALGETVNARIDYSYGARRAPLYNDNAFLALVPYANVSPAQAIGGATALSYMLDNGYGPWGPALGFTATTGNANVFFPSNNALANAAYANNNRISEIRGLRRYYVSDRDRHRVRSSLDWQATSALSIAGGIDFTGDDYLDASYGLQSSKGVDVHLDGTYALTDNVSASAFYSFDRQRNITNGNSYTANSNVTNVNGFTGLSGNACDSYTTLQQRNNNNKLDPCLDWSANMHDRVHTVGFSVLKKADRLTLSSDAVYARARTTYDVNGGNWANNPLALPGVTGTIAAYFIPATPLPVVTTNALDLRLSGNYTVRAHQSLRLIYAYMRLRSADWAYDGMQIGDGTPSGVLPTNETPFNYGVHVVGVSYVIAF